MRRTLFLVIVGAAALSADASAQRSGLWPQGGTTSLALTRHDVEVSIHRPLAEITVTQEFENPSSRQLEAYYYYPVPRSATVTNLALWVNGVRREARVMERQKAREIYQGIVNQKRDPALVERIAGDLFRIRIFPVPAKGRQRVELRFVQPVEQLDRTQYRLLLKKPPGRTSHALRLGVRIVPSTRLRRAWLSGYQGRLARVGEGYRMALSAAPRSFTRDIELRFELAAATPSPALAARRHEDGSTTFLAELPREPPASDHVGRLALLLDASASMAGDLEAARGAAHAILSALPAASSVQLIPFDILPRGSSRPALASAARLEELRDLVTAQIAQGGSAFVPTFERAMGQGARHIILITDGASPNHQAEFEHLLRLIFDRRGVVVSVILVGNSGAANPQADLLRDMTRITGGMFTRLSGALNPARIKKMLSRPLRYSARAMVGGEAVQGASLHTLSDASPHRLLVAGRIPPGVNAGRLDLVISDGKRYPVQVPPAGIQTRAATAPWAGAEIDHLERRIKLWGQEDELRDRIVALSKQHRVASEYTAFLVTETDADYRRPTSGRKWQRKVKKMGDNAPTTFHSTPEPHEVLMIALGLLLVWFVRRNRAIPDRS